MLQLFFYVPEKNLEEVLEAVFLAGAGKYQNYDKCCWKTKGEGQFRPLDNSNPYIGKRDILEKCFEYKVEILVANDKKEKVLAALKSSHPYEEPAYGFISLIL